MLSLSLPELRANSSMRLPLPTVGVLKVPLVRYSSITENTVIGQIKEKARETNICSTLALLLDLVLHERWDGIPCLFPFNVILEGRVPFDL